MSPEQTALYLYCFARPELAVTPAGNGVDGRSPVFARLFPSAAAVLSEVAREDFCGPSADAHLQDLGWLGPRACRHEEVIERVMQKSPVLPAPFGTLFSSPARLEEFLERHGETISRFLERVEGQEEWALKGLLDRAKARQAALATARAAHQARLAALPPGRRYLEEQRIEADADRALGRRLSETCLALAWSVRKHAAAFAERRVVSGATGEGEVILNWAFLLPKDNLAAFRAEVKSATANCAKAGLALQLSGPWPPYSFAPALSMEAEG